MSSEPPPEVRPVSLRTLAVIVIGTFLVLFLLLEVLDPRWISAFRPAATPTPQVAAEPRALRPLPTPRPRGASPMAFEGPAGTPPAEPPTAEPGEPAENGLGQAVVIGTDGQGARLRAAPSGQATVLGLLEEGTVVDLTGQDVEAEGRRWLEVRLQNGSGGWVAADFLAGLEPTPSP